MGDINIKNLNGGSVVAAGGYGCVTRPVIGCKNVEDDIDTNKGLVSKIMLKKHAKKEMDISIKFKKILSKLPDYKRYFLFPLGMCTPKNLTSDDKINFTLKCNTLLKKNFTVDNINSKLDSLKVIQMRDGGMDLDAFLRNTRIDLDIFGKVSNSLERLLANAILPMNALNVYHLDLKASNMMIDDKYEIKIVDWGLSTVITDFNVIPTAFRRPLHFNMPYSIIILNSDFLIFINNTLQKNPHITVETLIPKLISFYAKFSETYGSGHEERINDILHNLMNTKRYLHNEVIMRYIAEIIVEFREDDNTFNVTKYFKEVFLRNVDIWGFFHAYFPIMNLDTPRKQNYSQRAENFISDRFRELYTLFLLKYNTKPIPVLEFRDWILRMQQASKGTFSNISSFSFELESVVPLVGSTELSLKTLNNIKNGNRKMKKRKGTKKKRMKRKSRTNDMSKTMKNTK